MSLIDRGRPLRLSGHWQDWACLVLAVFLFLSPWLFAFAMPAGAGGARAASDASWDSWILGIVIAVLAAIAIIRLQAWQEWVMALLGLWLFLAPFLLGFLNVPGGAWTHWIVGVLLVILAVWDLQTLRGAALRRPIGQY